MIGLDTSVVLRSLTGQPAAQAEKARRALEADGGPAAVSDLVIGETYFALRHHYGVPHEEAIAALAAFAADARVLTSETALDVLRKMAGNPGTPGLMDRLIHGEYVRHTAATLVTFDRSAGRLPGARLL